MPRKPAAGRFVQRTGRIVAPAEFDLPASFAREIGRIMVHWAYFENALRRLAWDMLAMDAKTGRVAARDPGIDDRFDMLLDIAFLKNVTIDAKEIADLRAKANEIVRLRNLFAHGIWIPHAGQWLVQMTSGQYPKNFEAEHRKRRINPEGINIDLDGLQTVTHGIRILIERVFSLRAHILPQLSHRPKGESDV